MDWIHSFAVIKRLHVGFRLIVIFFNVRIPNLFIRRNRVRKRVIEQQKIIIMFIDRLLSLIK